MLVLEIDLPPPFSPAKDLLEAVPEPEPEPAPEQDVPPGLSALIAMELGDVGQCTKAFEFADGDVDTAIQVLLSGDIPPSE
eukprot:COSAG03_NODE_12701_length_535_cov_1.181193_1_plen_80_part_10